MHAAIEDLATWMHHLDEEAGISPSWETLFQAMCCPVPQSLKASLDRAIAALARRPEVATALWDRLLAAVVVLPVPLGTSGADALVSLNTPWLHRRALDDDAAAVPRYDLVYQLNEIEARAEEYDEVLAFVGLLNALWKSAGGALADGGGPVAHFTRFVKEDLLMTAFQRTFKDESQRWSLIAACFDHCRMCLTHAAASLVGGSAGTLLGEPRPPGMDVLVDLLGERSVARALVTTLSSLNVEILANERRATSSSAMAKEAAALAALRLLSTGFTCDAEFVSSMQQSQGRAAFETLDAVLCHDRARLPLLFDFVRYPYNSKIQEESLRLILAIVQRIPHVVPFLITADDNDSAIMAEDHRGILQRLQEGFAECLRDTIDGAAQSTASRDPIEEEQDDQRGDLVLNILLAALRPTAEFNGARVGPSSSMAMPNLTESLCGFDIESGVAPMALIDPRSRYTPLRVALETLMESTISLVRPRAYEQCLELVHALTGNHSTGPAMMDVLRGYYGSLTSLVEDVACAPMPTSMPGVRTASLHQRAMVLHILALQLHHADEAVLSHRDSVHQILSSLFSGPRGRILDILSIATLDDASTIEPQLGAGATAEVRRMLQALDVESLLASSRRPGEGGVRSVGVWGDHIVDIVTLKDNLLVRYNEWVARHGTPVEALKEAGRAAIAYASEFNDFMESLGARHAVLAGWHALVTVAFARRFDALARVVSVGSDATTRKEQINQNLDAKASMDIVLTMIDHTLEAISRLLRSNAARLASIVCPATAALFARLQEQAVAAATVDPLGGIPLPSRCHSLYAALLSAVWDGRAQESVRVPLYAAISSYISMCRGPSSSLLRAPPAMVDALLQKESSLAITDRLNDVMVALEEGNVAIVHSHLKLVDVLTNDATSNDSANSATVAAALAALAALTSSDPTTTVADRIHATGLPSRIVQELSDRSIAPISQPTHLGQAITVIIEAQLALLIRLTLAGPPSQRTAAARKLLALHTIPKLAHAQIIDIQPEEPGFSSTTVAAAAGATIRQRLHSIIAPLLRLIVTLLLALPGNTAAREQTAAFAVAHARTLARLLRDAASQGVRGWEPGDAELDEATLVICLLTEMVPYRRLVSDIVHAQLQEAVYRLACRFFAPNARSGNPALLRMYAVKESSANFKVSDDQTYSKYALLFTQ